jgi:AraC-like DNA-binding protein
VSASAALIASFLHGVAAGALAVIAFALIRSRLSVHVRVIGLLAWLSMTAMFINETGPLWRAVGQPVIVNAIACPVAGLFWLFVLSIFDDWKLSPLTLTPAAVLLASGLAMEASSPPLSDLIWASRNVLAGLLAIHAGVVIARGWRDDLLEGRRQFRGAVLGLSCVFVLMEVGFGFLFRLRHDAHWLLFTIGRPYGGLIVGMLTLSLAALLLQPRAAVFGATRRAETAPDTRTETADRQVLDKLNGLMATEGWRREGLTIGDLARELGAPEHRLRRLINQQLGHRNFADFVNSFRIEAAKRRLADPAEVRTTVAAIAFDLGYGSLGPFNRAFRAATGTSPTEWRRQALAQASPNLQEAV